MQINAEQACRTWLVQAVGRKNEMGDTTARADIKMILDTCLQIHVEEVRSVPCEAYCSAERALLSGMASLDAKGCYHTATGMS